MTTRNLRLALARHIATVWRVKKFSTSQRWNKRIKDMSLRDISNIKIDKSRLMTDLHYTCQWGSTSEGLRWGNQPSETGMCRLALTNDDKHARDWFVDTTRLLGCEVTIDEMGNIFGVRPGNAYGPPTCIGSHLDTQPAGGRYDGILGVHAGIEILKTLHDYDIKTEYPIGVINWTNEEGARFPKSMVSSGVWAGKIPLQTAHELASTENPHATQKSELQRIGYLGSQPTSHTANPIAAHFELHIEQGPILESSHRQIGIVQGAQAYKWFTVDVHGRSSHTGTTPYAMRADALRAACAMIVRAQEIAEDMGALASSGTLKLLPGSINSVPSFVSFSLDIRAAADDVVALAEERIRAAFAEIAKVSGNVQGCDDVHRASKGTATTMAKTPCDSCSVTMTTITESPAKQFDKNCIQCVEDAAKLLFGDRFDEKVLRMTSGAGHDSVYTSYVCPTTMIFIPCRDGISHNPVEFASPENCGLGAQVLLQSVLGYDKLRIKE